MCIIMLITILVANLLESNEKFPKLRKFFIGAANGFKYNAIITNLKEGFLPCLFFGILNLISMT